MAYRQLSAKQMRCQLLIKKHWWIILLPLLFFVSCGYKFAGTGHLPSGIRSTYIEVMENRSGETGIENTITNDLIYEFIRSGNTVSKDKMKADAILSGSIADLHIDAVTHKSAHSALEGRVTVLLDIKLTSSEGDIIWSAKGVSADQTYDIVANNTLATEQKRRTAIKALSKRLAEAVYDNLTTDF